MAEGGPYPIGKAFGPYVLESYLGKGAYKYVYRARNRGKTVSEPVVALGFPQELDADGVADLEKEFGTTRGLSYPNILRMFGVERHEGIPFLVMELLEGVSLRDKLREQGTLPVPLALRYAGMTSEALAYAHSQTMPIIHRDVKPDNIFIATGDIPKLLDFGLSRVLARASEKAGSRVGTWEYIAPEVLQGAASTNADIWSLGITLYEMITGQVPFRAEAHTELIRQILHEPHDEQPLRAKSVDNRVIRVLRNMLRKNPDERYQWAGDLARDLEIAARRVRMVDDDESRLEVLIRASYPLIGVFSYEEERVVAAVRGIAARLSEERGKLRRLYLWSVSRGLRDEADRPVSGDSKGDPTAALVHAIENPEDAIYLFLDMHPHFTPVTTRLIRDAARAVRQTRKSVLFLSPSFQLPDELEKGVNLAVFQLPDRAHFEPLVERIAEECRAAGVQVTISEAGRAALVRAASGLVLKEAERAIRIGVARLGGLVEGVHREVVQEKTQVIRKTGILEYYHASESFRDVGGLENLMTWFQERAPVFAGSARYAGLPQPKGVLLVGVPGCGKSLSARALAGTWGVPLVRLDVGRIFASVVGSSEANLRRAIQTAEAVSPCILWIDEVEKGFSGVHSQSGGGVAARVFGTFLNWLQEKRSPVFVVATANDIFSLPPEFLRSGRFDERFFVGLPSRAQRETILRIHLKKRGRNPDLFDVSLLAELAGGYSGSELEQVVIEGMFRAFSEDREVETRDIEAAIRETYPLSYSRAREIAALTRWAEKNAKLASLPEGMAA